MTGADEARQAAGYTLRSPALELPCTHCGAGYHEECHGLTAKTRHKRREPHPARLAAAAEPHAQVIPFRRNLPPDAPSG